MCERSVEKQQPDGAHALSQCYQWDCEYAGGGGGLHLSAQETSLGSVDHHRNPSPTSAFSGGDDLKLHRTHVNTTSLQWNTGNPVEAGQRSDSLRIEFQGR